MSEEESSGVTIHGRRLSTRRITKMGGRYRQRIINRIGWNTDQPIQNGGQLALAMAARKRLVRAMKRADEEYRGILQEMLETIEKAIADYKNGPEQS